MRVSRSNIVLAVASMMGGLVLTIVFLQRNGLWMDELYTLHAIRLPFREMILERLRRGHFPLYFLLQKESIALFFDGRYSEVSLRTLSLTAYLAAVGSFVLLAKRFLSPTSAAIAVTFFALNGLALRQAVEARMYTLALLEGVWIIRAYLEMAEGGNKPIWKWVLLAVTLVGFWTSASVSLLLGVIVLDSWFRRKQAPRLFRWNLAALVIGFATLIPGVLVHFQTRQKGEIAHVPREWAAAHMVTFISGIFADDDYFDPPVALRVLQGIGAALTLGILFTLWKRRRTLPSLELSCLRIVTLPIIMLITWALSYIVPLEINLLGPARYIIGIMPCGALLAANQLSFWAADSPRRAITIHAALLAFLLAGALMILTIQFEPGQGRSFRWLTRELKARYKPGDGAIAVPYEIADGTEMYVPGLKVDVAIDRWETDQQTLEDLMKPLSDRKNVWLIWYRGRESKAVAAGIKLWGRPVSSGRVKDQGMLRLFLFTPPGSH